MDTNILEEVAGILTELNIEFQTGRYTNEEPDELVVVVPMEDTYAEFADNIPKYDRQQARLAILCRAEGSRMYKLRDKIVKELFKANFSILSRIYAGFNSDTKHHVMVVEIEGVYPSGVGTDGVN